MLDESSDIDREEMSVSWTNPEQIRPFSDFYDISCKDTSSWMKVTMLTRCWRHREGQRVVHEEERFLKGDGRLSCDTRAAVWLLAPSRRRLSLSHLTRSQHDHESWCCGRAAGDGREDDDDEG